MFNVILADVLQTFKITNQLRIKGVFENGSKMLIRRLYTQSNKDIRQILDVNFSDLIEESNIVQIKAYKYGMISKTIDKNSQPNNYIKSDISVDGAYHNILWYENKLSEEQIKKYNLKFIIIDCITIN